MSVFIKNNETLKEVIVLLKDVETLEKAERAINHYNYDVRAGILKEAAKKQLDIYKLLKNESKIDVDNMFNKFKESFFEFIAAADGSYIKDEGISSYEFIYYHSGVLSSYIYGGSYVKYMNNKWIKEAGL